MAIVWPPFAAANTSTVVSIFVDGTKRVVSTDASSVGEILKRANVELRPQDLVEPAADTPFSDEIFNINVYRAKPVIVIDGSQQFRVNSAYQSPKLIVERSAGLAVYDEDQYQTELIQDHLSEGVGMKVTVERAVPVVIKVDGVVLPIRTQKASVGEMLSDRGVVLGPADQLNVAKETAITPNLEVAVIRVGQEVVAVEEVVPAPVQYIYDSSKTADYELVKEVGSDGKRLVTYQIIRHNGQEVQRQPLQTVVVTEVKTRVIVKGVQRTAGADWAGLRQCESGGNYQSRSNPLYRGAYQFSYSTWQSVGGSGDPADASPSEQDHRAQLLYQRSGRRPWPVCGARYLP